MSWRSVGVGVGRGLLILLTVIHLVLPWTPANNSDDTVILVGALVIGGGFLATAVWSRQNPRPALTVGAMLFLAVETVAAATDASPWEEGWPIKLILSLLFAYALAAVWLPTRT